MTKIMFVGKTGSGKTTLCQNLHREELKYRKTQALEFKGCTIDTPGEYSENRMYYKALIVTSFDVDKIAFVQSAEQDEIIFPPGFTSLFANKEIIGIVTKIDLYPDRVKRAEELLNLIGVSKNIYKVNSLDLNSVKQLDDEIFINAEASV